MTPKAAAEMLDVRLNGLTEEAVRKAFADAAKRVHPDTSGEATQLGAEFLRHYKQARDLLLREVKLEAGFIECDLCGGTGKQKTRSGGLVKCSRCAGAGRYRKKEISRG